LRGKRAGNDDRTGAVSCCRWRDGLDTCAKTAAATNVTAA